MDPFDPKGQRLTESRWRRAIELDTPPEGVRELVRTSWERSRGARVRPDLSQAPVVLDEESLAATRESAGWLTLAEEAIGQPLGQFSGPAHILTLFDVAGRMLASQGDPHALDQLAGINFRPGALWDERAVGTNGPGTALATGQPAHIVGAEHFCESWHPWHCAAVPIRDQITGALLGVLDISGPREYAHPHTLSVAAALSIAIEQALAARDAQRRCLALEQFARLSSRYPGDAMVAVDRGGRVLFATPTVPDEWQPPAGAPPVLAQVLRRSEGGAVRDISVSLRGSERSAVWHPVVDNGAGVGGCLVLRALSAGRRTSRPVRRLAAVGGARYTFADLIGESLELHSVQRLGTAAATNSLSVLILGESGTGKELLAQAIHSASDRRDQAFIAVNCAALPTELIETELFGYTAGAFTGARREGGIGKFEAADGGTIFLDEIGDLSPTSQAALLRVLQEGEITPVGSSETRRVDVRVIAATNRPVAELVDKQRLRLDLYHRLNVLAIEIPPLRERPDDIAALTAYFVDAAARELGRPACAFEDEVVEAFCWYPWPGNVRELQNTVRRLVALAERFPITLDDLPPIIRAARSDMAAPPTEPVVDDSRAERLIKVVASARSLGDAASQLGITRSTLYRQMQRYNLRPTRVLRPTRAADQ